MQRCCAKTIQWITPPRGPMEKAADMRPAREMKRIAARGGVLLAAIYVALRLLLVRGAVPGSKNGHIVVSPAVKVKVKKGAN